ncbi:DNA polymerase III subunit chi [uncultured Gammaproteobacteria bacterium]
MTEIRFYHLQRQSLEQVLPQILLKVIERDWRAVVVAGSPERVEMLTQMLWAFDPASFLPHGSVRDGYASDQPIWLTAREENPNQATVLIVTDGVAATNPGDYTLVCDLFDGNMPEAVVAARERWRTVKAAGHELTYWQQGARGGWERKA